MLEVMKNWGHMSFSPVRVALLWILIDLYIRLQISLNSQVDRTAIQNL